MKLKDLDFVFEHVTQVLWNHFCPWGFNVCGFHGVPLPMNLRPNERLQSIELSCIVIQQTICTFVMRD